MDYKNYDNYDDLTPKMKLKKGNASSKNKGFKDSSDRALKEKRRMKYAAHYVDMGDDSHGEESYR